MSKKLSSTQKRALDKLTSEWQSAYDVQESISTLDSLVNKGFAKSHGHGGLGSLYDPRTAIEYKLAAKIPERVLS